MSYNLTPAQEQYRRGLLARKQAFLFEDMGVGKTFAVMSALDDLVQLGEVKTAYVVAPATVARVTWPDEMEKFGFTRLKEVVKLTSYESLHKVWKEAYAADIIIYDEVTKLKGHATRCSKAAHLAWGPDKRIWAMSGTPFANDLEGAWSIAAAVTGKRGIFRQPWYEWRNAWFYQKPWDAYNWYILPEKEQEMMRRFEPFVVRADAGLAEASKNVKPREMLEVVFDLSPAERECYDIAVAEQVLAFNQAGKSDAKGDIFPVPNRAVLASKLLQLSGGMVYVKDGGRQKVGDSKLQALLTYVKSSGSNALVLYAYRHEADRLAKNLPGSVDLSRASVSQRSKIVADWNAGRIPALLAHPASCGHGLNLAAGGSVLIWFSLPWSLESYKQANARLWRKGQEETVKIIHLLGKKTIDKDVMERLTERQAKATSYLQILKGLS